MTDAPGATGPSGQVTAGAACEPVNDVTVTVGDVAVWLPVLVTTRRKVTCWPAAVTVAGEAEPESASPGVGVVVTVAVEAAESTLAPPGVVPVATAVFDTEPASRSACVTAYDAVQVRLPPGATVPLGQVTAGTVPEPVNRVSATLTPLRLTLPVLRTSSA